MQAVLYAVLIRTLQAIRLIEHYQVNLYALPLLFVLFKRILSLCDLPYVQLAHNADIQGVSRLEDITAGGDFLGLCDQKSSYKHVSDFGRLRSYDHLNLGREGNDY